MSSQLDLDQGGMARTFKKVWEGPSIGWIWIPDVSVLPITSTGTFNLDPSTNYVTVNFNGSGVVIILPTAIANPAGAQALPNLFAQSPITIVDIGGFAQSNNIVIKPFSVAETIMGLAQISINTNFGGYTLAPNSQQKTWNSISP